jgi:tetratricopeptide (TPR) repeat protein
MVRAEGPNVKAELSRTDKLHLSAAEGWFGLGNHLSADEELTEITPELRAHPDVLKVRLEIYSEMKKWGEALDLAKAYIKLRPNDRIGFILASNALHALKRTQEALETLMPVVDRFPDDLAITYNLACYSCQLGNFKTACQWLERAFDIAPWLIAGALNDPDLEPLWVEIAEV